MCMVTLNCTAKYEITVRGTDMECVRRREGGDEEGEGEERRGGKGRRVRGEEGGEEREE